MHSFLWILNDPVLTQDTSYSSSESLVNAIPVELRDEDNKLGLFNLVKMY